MAKTLTNTQKLIILVIIILALSMLFSGVSLFGMKRDHNGRGTAQTITFKGGFSDIEIRGESSDVRFYKTNERTGKVVWSGPKSMKLTVDTRNGRLTIREKHKRFWFLRAGISFKPSEMLIYLPENSYRDLEIHTDTASAGIPAEFSFKNAIIRTDTGAVEFQAKVSKKLEIHTDTGSISASRVSPEEFTAESDTGGITLNNIRAGKDLRAETDTGRIRITDVRCEDINVNSDTGSITLTDVIAADEMDIENDTGSVRLDRCDAASISVETDTGTISGTLLSDKVFRAKSGTGHVSVPDTVTGGPCVLKSDTGSIEISVAVK